MSLEKGRESRSQQPFKLYIPNASYCNGLGISYIQERPNPLYTNRTAARHSSITSTGCYGCDLVRFAYYWSIPETVRGNGYVLHLIDYFDRMSFASASLGCSSEDTVNGLAAHIAYYPTPAAIFCDPSKHYVAKYTKQFCKANGIYLAYLPSGASRS